VGALVDHFGKRRPGCYGYVATLFTSADASALIARGRAMLGCHRVRALGHCRCTVRRGPGVWLILQWPVYASVITMIAFFSGFVCCRQVCQCMHLWLMCAGDVESNPGPVMPVCGGALSSLMYFPWMICQALLPMAYIRSCHHHLLRSSICYYDCWRCLRSWAWVVLWLVHPLCFLSFRSRMRVRRVRAARRCSACRPGMCQGGTQSRGLRGQVSPLLAWTLDRPPDLPRVPGSRKHRALAFHRAQHIWYRHVVPCIQLGWLSPISNLHLYRSVLLAMGPRGSRAWEEVFQDVDQRWPLPAAPGVPPSLRVCSGELCSACPKSVSVGTHVMCGPSPALNGICEPLDLADDASGQPQY
jgi:hypothetical protein